MPDVPRLVILSGPLAREAILLDGPAPLVFGTRAGYALPDPALDAVHALVFAVDGAFYLQDLGSVGGTFVGEARLEGARRLADGDTFQLGETWLGFLATADSAPRRAPKQDPEPAQPVIPRRLRAGDTCGDYRIEAVVAEDALGQLLRGRDAKRARTVALKVLDPQAAADRQRVARFLRGAKLGGRIKHPTVARVLGAGHADGHVYVLREWIEGQSLAEACEAAGGRLEPRRALELGLELLDGLAHLHAQGVVHSHVSPRDVLLSTDGRPKLLGLGLAKKAFKEGQKALEVTDDHEVLIPSAYVAPEAAIDRAHLDPRADVYGLAATLAFLLCGRAPFPQTPDREALLAGTTLAPREEIPELSEALDAALRRALSPDPAARPQSAEALRAELAAVPEAEGLVEPEPEPEPAPDPEPEASV
ncbi:MAG: FHA domain-containing serine/threonine-protein kinase [Planctomycetota bacterium]